jgi:hypothetical protein
LLLKARLKKIPGFGQSSRMIQCCLRAQAVDDMQGLSLPEAVLALNKETIFKTNFQE